MYLVDTNVRLERLLDQVKSQEVGQYLGRTPSEQFFITDFAFHSVAIVLSKLGHVQVLLKFVQDAFTEGAISLVHLEPEDIPQIASTMDKFNLDFDDAYQYVAADKYGLAIISFDSDFDRSERGKKISEVVMQG